MRGRSTGAGSADSERLARPAGHRSVPHTADLRIEAWGPTRERCFAEAVQAVTGTFVDLTDATGTTLRSTVIRADRDEDLLVALLEEIVYRLDTAGEVPVEVGLTAVPGGLEAAFHCAAVGSLPQTGAAPKAVTLHGLACDRGPEGWSCSVTLDV
ncbi:archease [Streptomyces meridianus]|uniref:Archease n=1 Tax=Streptomyces meridianus TaxID=2938945 RepID=A0ABT0X3W8_9ACTN|nr:archease [Streptomyces meridianus]MCM2577223.1 archease [Streptomyces meridianus]